MISIRRHLLISLFSALLVSGLAMGAMTYFTAKDEIDELFDAHLKDVALLALRQEPSITATMVHPDINGDGNDDEDIVVQIWDDHKGLIYHTDPNIHLPYPDQGGFSDVTIQNKNWRIYSGQADGQTAIAAYSGDDRQYIITSIVFRILIPLMVISPILGLLIWLGIGRGLAPLTNIGSSLKRREAHNLTPLSDQDTPEEIQPVIKSLNELFQRLTKSISAQKKFVADAAHELRTPLTAIQFQLELAETAKTEQDRAEALSTLKSGINRAIHLTQQLLSLARQEPPSIPEVYKVISLLDLARSSVTQLLPYAMTKNIDLGIVDPTDKNIWGDAESLQVMLNNLLDNAIRYSPQKSRIDIGITGNDKEHALSISDSGPGINAEEYDRIFDRFYRIPGTSETGTGLGLAIVKAIADKHGARIELSNTENNKGLTIKIIFPNQSGSK